MDRGYLPSGCLLSLAPQTLPARPNPSRQDWSLPSCSLMPMVTSELGILVVLVKLRCYTLAIITTHALHACGESWPRHDLKLQNSGSRIFMLRFKLCQGKIAIGEI